MLSLSSAALSLLPAGGVGTTDAKPWSSSAISDSNGLRALAKQLNPVVGYWDPLEIFSDKDGNVQGSKENIAWYRHAEIKHGRVAMAAFVGYCVQANGIHFPGNLAQPLVPSVFFQNTPTVSFADLSALSPPEQWDAMPTAAKMQILLFVGFLELWGESSLAFEKAGTQHYVRGGTPGYYPPIKGLTVAPLNLYDPFGFSKKRTEEQKANGLLTEINNGRLAMLGIFAFVAESKVPNSVPVLSTLGIKPYAGEVMAPFTASDASLPFVDAMLKINPLIGQ